MDWSNIVEVKCISFYLSPQSLSFKIAFFALSSDEPIVMNLDFAIPLLFLYAWNTHVCARNHTVSLFDHMHLMLWAKWTRPALQLTSFLHREIHARQHLFKPALSYWLALHWWPSYRPLCIPVASPLKWDGQHPPVRLCTTLTVAPPACAPKQPSSVLGALCTVLGAS